MSKKINIFIPVIVGDGYLSHIIKNLKTKENFSFVENENEADVFLIPFAGFRNNSSFLLENRDYKKPIIIIDYTEYGVHRLRNKQYFNSICTGLFIHTETTILLKELNASDFGFKLHNFLITNTHNIKLYFMRELSRHVYEEQHKYFTFSVQPIDYILTAYPDFEPSSKESFFERNLKTTFIYGRSNSDRMNLHGAILSHSSANITYHDTILSVEQCNNYIANQKKQGIVILQKCGYERIDFKPYLNNSLTFIDMYGNGMKCFRNPESAYNCISLKQDYSQLKFAYDWIDNVNCIMLPNMQHENSIDTKASVDIITKITTNKFDQDKLYEIYLNSCELSKKYFIENYVQDHIVANISKVLELS